MRSLVLAALIVTGAKLVKAEISGSPPSLYVSRGACPFECCVYRDWTANRDVPLFDHPDGRPIGQIRKHDVVSAQTGEIRTHPLRFRVAQKGSNQEEIPVPLGSIVYLLHPIGEGYWLVWFQGKTIEMDPAYNGPGPQYEWWAKIKTRSGQLGLILMKGIPPPFDNADSCT